VGSRLRDRAAEIELRGIQTRDSDRLTSLETTFGCSRQNQSIHSPSEGCSRRRMLTAIWSSAHEETACLCSRFFPFDAEMLFGAAPYSFGARLLMFLARTARGRHKAIVFVVLRAQVPAGHHLVVLHPHVRA